MQFYLLFPLIIGLFRRDNGPLVTTPYRARQRIGPILRRTLSDAAAFANVALSKVGPLLANEFFYWRSLLRQSDLLRIPWNPCWTTSSNVTIARPSARCSCSRPACPPAGARSWQSCSSSRSCSWPMASACSLDGPVRAPLLRDLPRSLRPGLGGHLAPADGSVTDVSAGRRPLIGVEHFVVEPMIERRFNRLGHALASGIGRRRAIAGVT